MKPQGGKHHSTPPKTQPIFKPYPEAKPQFQIDDFVRLKDKPDMTRRIVEIGGDSWRFYWFGPQLIAE
jgi:hypothetical protein